MSLCKSLNLSSPKDPFLWLKLYCIPLCLVSFLSCYSWDKRNQWICRFVIYASWGKRTRAIVREGRKQQSEREKGKGEKNLESVKRIFSSIFFVILLSSLQKKSKKKRFRVTNGGFLSWHYVVALGKRSERLQKPCRVFFSVPSASRISPSN